MNEFKKFVIELFTENKRKRFMYLSIYLICKRGLVKSINNGVFEFNEDTKLFEKVNLRKLMNDTVFPLIVSDNDVKAVWRYLTPIDNIGLYNAYINHDEENEYYTHSEIEDIALKVKSEYREFKTFRELLLNKYKK